MITTATAPKLNTLCERIRAHKGGPNKSFMALLAERGALYSQHQEDAAKLPANAPDLALRAEFRGKHISDLLKKVNLSHDGLALAVTETELFEARRAVAGRNECARLVHGALASMDHKYTGTGGWWVVPMVSPEKFLGFVDIAAGTAIITDVMLSDEIIEAATIANQTEGVLASGAAAWSSPDVGLAVAVTGTTKSLSTVDNTKELATFTIRAATPAERPAYPAGWLQLLCDVRTDKADVEAVPCKTKIVVYGLRNCYGGQNLPRPFDRRLADGTEKFSLDPADWPLSLTQAKACRSIANEVLSSEALRINTSPDQYPDQKQRFWSHDSHEGQRSWCCAKAAREVSAQVIRASGARPMFFAGLRHLDLDDVVGSRSIDKVEGSLTAKLYSDLLPVYDALIAAGLTYDALRAPGSCLRAVAAGLAEPIKKQVESAADAALDRMGKDVLYVDGPLSVR